MQVLLFQKI